MNTIDSGTTPPFKRVDELDGITKEAFDASVPISKHEYKGVSYFFGTGDKLNNDDFELYF